MPLNVACVPRLPSFSLSHSVLTSILPFDYDSFPTAISFKHPLHHQSHLSIHSNPLQKSCRCSDLSCSCCPSLTLTPSIIVISYPFLSSHHITPTSAPDFYHRDPTVRSSIGLVPLPIIYSPSPLSSFCPLLASL